MIATLGIALLLTLWPQRVEVSRTTDEFVVWNVGQGQWITLAQDNVCLHVDMGGEFADWKSIRRLCRTRLNRVYFSHWDMDHISFAPRARRNLPNLCVAAEPGGAAPSRRRHLLELLPRCRKTHPAVIELTVSQAMSRTDRRASSNDASRIFILNNRILVPGDAGARIERALDRAPLAQVEWLVLGHHGSRTSNSPELIKNLIHLKLAISSSRYKRYGHPHRTVLDRLKHEGTPVLRTEDWGHIRMINPGRTKGEPIKP